MTPEESPKKGLPWYVWVGFVVLGLGWGLNSYLNQPAKPPANSEAHAQDKATNARVKVLQQQLGEIGERPSATVDDYIKNTLDATPIIDEARGLIPLQMASVERVKREHPDDPKVAMVADYALRMFQKDAELMSLMGNEVYCARALQALPSAKQMAYYNENVLPLKEKERQAGREWAALANEASAKGVAWSDYVTKGAKALQ